jgi:hypothetical protein
MSALMKIALIVAGLAMIAASFGLGPTKRIWMIALAAGIAAALIIFLIDHLPL